ncbi:MAG TPA: hypothetical protein VGP94_12355, partial [Tepidisphaeraceae bacterium]|nr:hypothetical protein [Tepidisphaeraceae bacterium]
MQLFRSTHKFFIILVLVVAGSAATASAALLVENAPPGPNYHFSMKVDDGAPISMYGTVTPIPNGDKWNYQITGYYDSAGSKVNFNVLIDPDPSVLAHVDVLNTTGSTHNYAFDFTTPTPTFNPSLLSGSVGVT